MRVVSEIFDPPTYNCCEIEHCRGGFFRGGGHFAFVHSHDNCDTEDFSTSEY